MPIVTRWMDEKTTDIDEAIRLMTADHPDETPENGTQYINWKIEKKFGSNKECVMNGRTVQYNYIAYSVDQIPSGADPSDDATYTKSGFVIPYASAGKVRYIISRNAYAQTHLRKMLGYSGKGEIVSNSVGFTGDIFIWLIRKVYSCENTIFSENDNMAYLNIDSIKGFKGNTEDLLAKVSVSGESVMNIISALSFLIESQNLNQVTINLSYRKHTSIEVSLNNKNTIGFNEEKYLGELNQESKEEIIAKCLLMLYSEILPIIIQTYQSDFDNEQWGKGTCVKFLKQVARDLELKVRSRIEDLNSRPEQLSLGMSTKRDA